MKYPLNYYTLLAKRWAWVVILGIVICSGATFIVSKRERPVYQASTILMLNLGTSSSAFDNLTASVQALPTYAQLLVTPPVLNPVIAEHPGLTLQQLKAMITAKPQSNTQLIELDVQNSDPLLAMQLANDISLHFAQYTNAQLQGTIQIVSAAQQPTAPIRPQVLLNTGIGALVGLGLALGLIFIFEWIDDRLAKPEEVQELLDTELLAVIPQLSPKQGAQKAEARLTSAEGYRMLATSLNLTQRVTPFKLLMITSAVAGEGKSTVAKNLASFLAMVSQRVLLVDAHLSSPALAQYFQLDNQGGLANASTGTWAEVEKNLDGQPTDIPNLHVLAAGVLASSSTDLLQPPWVNHLFEHFTKAPFDYVIFDTPPLLPVADTQVWASYADAIVVVVDASKTPRRVLLRAKRALYRTGSMVVGAVINKSRWTDHHEIPLHLNGAQQKRAEDIATARTLLHRVIPMAKPPDTPPLNGRVQDPISVNLPPPPTADKDDEL